MEKVWYCGIKGIEFLYHGDWSDPTLKLNDCMVNARDIEDVWYERYSEDLADGVITKETEFAAYMREHGDDVKNDITFYYVTAHEHDEVRRCSHCGKPMKEGYYLGGQYACDEYCAIALYGGNRKQFEQDLEEDEETCAGEVYWTEWESIYTD